MIGVEGLNARHMTPETLLEAREEALSERVVSAEPRQRHPARGTLRLMLRSNGGPGRRRIPTTARTLRSIEIEASRPSCHQGAGKRAEAGSPPCAGASPGREDVAIPQAFGLVTGDLSFISLTLVLGPESRCRARPGNMLVKPQFELQPGQVGKGGIVRDAGLAAEVESGASARSLRDLGLQVIGWHGSAIIQGGDGKPRKPSMQGGKRHEPAGEFRVFPAQDARGKSRQAARRAPAAVRARCKVLPVTYGAGGSIAGGHLSPPCAPSSKRAWMRPALSCIGATSRRAPAARRIKAMGVKRLRCAATCPAATGWAKNSSTRA